MSTARFNTDGFTGTVILKNWMTDPLTGERVMGVMGTVRIIKAADALGFDITDDSNWIARVEGPNSSYNFPGCQVAAVLDHPAHQAPHRAADTLLAP